MKCSTLAKQWATALADLEMKQIKQLSISLNKDLQSSTTIPTWELSYSSECMAFTNNCASDSITIFEKSFTFIQLRTSLKPIASAKRAEWLPILQPRTATTKDPNSSRTTAPKPLKFEEMLASILHFFHPNASLLYFPDYFCLTCDMFLNQALACCHCTRHCRAL